MTAGLRQRGLPNSESVLAQLQWQFQKLQACAARWSNWGVILIRSSDDIGHAWISRSNIYSERIGEALREDWPKRVLAMLFGSLLFTSTSAQAVARPLRIKSSSVSSSPAFFAIKLITRAGNKIKSKQSFFASNAAVQIFFSRGAA